MPRSFKSQKLKSGPQQWMNHSDRIQGLLSYNFFFLIVLYRTCHARSQKYFSRKREYIFNLFILKKKKIKKHQSRDLLI